MSVFSLEKNSTTTTILSSRQCQLVAADITINHRGISYTTINVCEQIIHYGNCRHGESINDIVLGVQVSQNFGCRCEEGGCSDI